MNLKTLINIRDILRASGKNRKPRNVYKLAINCPLQFFAITTNKV